MNPVELVRHGAVAVVRLTDPARRNAISLEMVRRLVELVDAVENDGEVGAVVITGAGRSFCAGADLSLLERAADGEAAGERALRSVYELFGRIYRCRLPTIAAVNGAAVGAGLNLALACDVRVVGESAKLSARFLQLGLHPGGGHTWLMQRLVGPATTSYALLFGQDFDGTAAVSAGLASECVPDDDLFQRSLELAERASSYHRDTVVSAKSTIRELADVHAYEPAVEIELARQIASAQGSDFRTRIRAVRGAATPSPAP